jgi:hypothetical protein
LVPWLKRPAVKWSKATSTTRLGASGCHSLERLVLQRLGPPGARPVKPGGLDQFFELGGQRLACAVLDV